MEVLILTILWSWGEASPLTPLGFFLPLWYDDV